MLKDIIMDINNVSISKEEYDELLDKAMFLYALESCGVDNWDYYDMAKEMYREMLKDSKS